MEGLKRVRLSVLSEVPNSGYERVFHDASVESPTMDIGAVEKSFEKHRSYTVVCTINRLRHEDMMVLSNFIIFNNWRKQWKV